MKRALVICKVLFSFGIFLLGLSGLPLFGQSPKPAATKKRQAADTPGKIWTSITTKKEYRVRIEGDRFYAEWVAPPEAARQGAYIRTECRRSGEKWIGTTDVFLLCPESTGTSGKARKGCHLTFRFEVHSMSAERITGRGESLRDFDCQNCQVRQTGWADFVWVPKGKPARAKSVSATASRKK